VADIVNCKNSQLLF